MTRGGRRTASALLVIAAVLFGGRALATFLTDRWWLDAAAPHAAPFFLRRTLLRTALDLWAVLLATLWWAGHATAVISAAAVPDSSPGGNPVVRRVLRHPDARAWAMVLAVALGLVMGLGAGEWADSILLAWQGVRFELADPALGADAGVLVADLPVWLRLHAYVAVLTLSTTGVVLASHLLTGAVRIGRGRLAIGTSARRQLGVLFGMLALVLAGHQLLIPYQQAAGLAGNLEPGVVLLHRTVGFVLFGVGLAAVAVSLTWAVQPIHRIAAGTWLAYTLFLVAAYFLLPSGEPWPATAEDRALRAQLEQAAYGFELREADASVWSGGGPALWHRDVVRALVAGDTSAPAAVRYSATEPSGRPAWVAQRRQAQGEIALIAVADDTADPGGRPLFLSSSAPGSLLEVPTPVAMLPRTAVRPGAPPVVVDSGSGGLVLGGVLRRLAMGWALQSVAVLGRAAGERAAWHLAPQARLARVAPFATWQEPRFALLHGEPAWVVPGLVTAATFPGVRAQQWEGRRVGYVRVGFVGVVRATGGSTRVYLVPGADPVSVAWSRVANEVVESPEAIPPGLLRGFHGGTVRLQAIASLWTASEAERLAREAGDLAVLRPVEHGSAITVAVVDRPAERLHGVLEARWDAGRDLVAVHRPDSLGLEAPSALERRWARFRSYQMIRDSVANAEGTRFTRDTVHYLPTRFGLLGYQPMWGVTPSGSSSLLMVGVARHNRVGLGRSFSGALRALNGDEAQEVGPAQGEPAVLFEARRLLRLADSALRGGDLVAFARAFAALRSLLGSGGPRLPPP